jgi:hypothetical protein
VAPASASSLGQCAEVSGEIVILDGPTAAAKSRIATLARV